MVKYHYKYCSSDTTEEVESDEEDKQIKKQLSALIDDNISEKTETHIFHSSLSEPLQLEEIHKKVEKPNNPTHVIKINGDNYVPITNRTAKPVTFDGVKYIPVYTAPAEKVD